MATIEGYEFPDELYYHEKHAWLRVEDDGTVTIGLNDLAQQQAGEIMYVDLPFEDDEVEAGETCVKVQTAKWVGPVSAPVSGTVIETSEDAQDEPELINTSCYDEGWLIKVQPSDLDADLANLMKGEEALSDWVKAEVARAEAEKAKGEGSDE